MQPCAGRITRAAQDGRNRNKLINLQRDDALIIVYVQNDFCPAGALPIEDDDKVIPRPNGCIGAILAQHVPM